MTPILHPPPTIRGTTLENITVGSLYDFSKKRLMTSYEIGLKYNVFLTPAIMFKLHCVLVHNMPPLAMRPHLKPLPKSITTFLSKKNSAKMLRTILYGPSDQSHSKQLKTVLNTYVLGHFPETKQNEYLNTWFLSFLPACLKEFALLHC